MARILSVWSPNWPIASFRRRTRTAGARPADPFALVESVKGARRLSALDEAAAAEGLFVGQALADALALVPALVTADADPEADREGLEKLCDWCVRFSPAVAVDAPDGLLMDVTGLAHLWGGEAALVADLLARLAGNGVPVRGAIADTAGAAWALARFPLDPSSRPDARESGRESRDPASATPVAARVRSVGAELAGSRLALTRVRDDELLVGPDWTISPPGAHRAWLKPLPVDALRPEPEAAAQLRRLGVRTVEQLTALPRAQLAKRFGMGLLTRLDQAMGEAEEALVFRRPVPPWFERLAFVEPISAPDDLARVAADACAKICARLEASGRAARRFELVFHRLNGTSHALTAGTALAARDPARLARLFAPKLEAVDPGFGIEAVTIEAGRVEGTPARQGGLTGETDTAEDFAGFVDRLSNRLGEDRVWRAAPVQTWVPEKAVAHAAPMSAPAGGWDPERPRPVRLFRRPEAIEATAPVPDDPPLFFRWRGRLHRVRRAEGPERIAQEWWKKPLADASPERVRDYYRVEDTDGARFWIFRTGLYGGERPSQWFVHGLFG
ncbi:DNA polymerase Y family protein [Caulobacter sp. 17J80-11]|uniref:Y-family DNA polymerase n=1 Tax=Caulobacter sp. 17J80-11 TaxID=2763502 RepID=UPI002103091F|nr:DNA polymerase Y family protein [Caulobacter sp. 17J80-11]